MSKGVVPYRLKGLSKGFGRFIEHKGAKFEIIQILDLSEIVRCFITIIFVNMSLSFI